MRPWDQVRIESAVIDEFKGIASLKIHSGTTIKDMSWDEGALIPSTVPIKDLHIGVGSVRAKVIQEWDASHERMLQSGLFGDRNRNDQVRNLEGTWQGKSPVGGV